MKYLSVALIAVTLCQSCFAPPVSPNKEKENDEDSQVGGLEDYMEYHRYLKEVVNALESDPDFRKKLEKAEESDIRSGKIAEELEFVSHHVRTRLDEIKRVELNRLRELTERKRQLMQNIDNEDPSHGHLDHSNPHTFEIDDLKKLIAKTTEDLAEADRKRKEEFKQYELQKEYEKQVKLNHTNGEERERLEREYRERTEKHKKHEKLHEPGHKAQLEEVWEEQDQMQQEFDPKTFFMLHDVDSNGLWDQDEVKALFIKELEKMYKAGEPEDDMRERAEEMERMRESVFKEVDLNRDGFIDYEEFLAQTRRNDFQQDHGWQGLDERRPYTDEELEEYIRQHQANQMRQRYPPNVPPYPGQMPPGAYQIPPAQHPNALPPQAQYHPNGIPPQPQFHQPPPLPGHLPDLNTNEIYPHMQQQPHQRVNPPQGGYPQHNVQPPQGGYPQQNQHPPANFQPNQPQQGVYQQPNPQQPPQVNYQQPPQQHQQGNQQPQQGNQQPQQVNQQPQQVNQQPQQVNQQPQQVNQQPPQQVNQQAPVGGQPQQNQVPQNSPQVNQQQQQQQGAPVPPAQPQQPVANVQAQNVPVQGNNLNAVNPGSPQVNQV